MATDGTFVFFAQKFLQEFLECLVVGSWMGWLGLWLGNCYCWGFFGGQGVCGFLEGGLQTCDLCMTFLFF